MTPYPPVPPPGHEWEQSEVNGTKPYLEHHHEPEVHEFGSHVGPECDGAETYESAPYFEDQGSGFYEETRLTTEVDTASQPAPKRSPIISRRRMLQGLVLTGVAGAGAANFIRSGQTPNLPLIDQQPSGSAAPSANPFDLDAANFGRGPDAAPVDQRILVLVELEGGNDGLSTVAPLNMGTYYDLRPNMGIAEGELLAFDDERGLNPNLVGLSEQRITALEGVGPVEGTMSHFDMVRRWEQGDMLGNSALEGGFLGRLVDGLGSDAPLVGLSVGGDTPRFAGTTSSFLSLENHWQLNVLINDDWIFPGYRDALRSFAGGPLATEMAGSWQKLFTIGDQLNIDQDDFNTNKNGGNEDPMIADGGDLGRQLMLAAGLIKADLGIRVIHARLGGFDTHENHNNRHASLMTQLDAALTGFLGMMAEAGYEDRVLVATTSEFGRRVQENSGGFDHGAASTMLLSGPIRTGRRGELAPLTNLDDGGNLRTTVPFDRYLATLAQEWLGVEAASILPDSPKPIELF